jgi:hypothetical protein
MNRKMTSGELNTLRHGEETVCLEIGVEIEEGEEEARETIGQFSYYYRIRQDQPQYRPELSNEKIGVRRFKEPHLSEKYYSIQQAQYSRLAQAVDRQGRPFSLVNILHADPKENIVVVEHIEESALGIQKTWWFSQTPYEALPQRSQVVLDQIRELFVYAIKNYDPVDFKVDNLRLQGNRCILCDFYEHDFYEDYKGDYAEEFVDKGVKNTITAYIASRLKSVVKENKALAKWFLEGFDESFQRKFLSKIGLEERSPQQKRNSAGALLNSKSDSPIPTIGPLVTPWLDSFSPLLTSEMGSLQKKRKSEALVFSPEGEQRGTPHRKGIEASSVARLQRRFPLLDEPIQLPKMGSEEEDFLQKENHSVLSSESEQRRALQHRDSEIGSVAKKRISFSLSTLF